MKRLLTSILFLVVFGKVYAQPTSITLGAFSGTFCAGATSTVSYTSAGGGTAKYGANNVFYVEISNATGTYSSSVVNIGTLLDDERSGSVSLSFPSTLPSGTGYRIRIVSSTSQTANQGISSANSGAFSINAAPSIAISTISSVCVGTNTMSVGYTSATGSPNQYSVTWNAASLAAGLSNVAFTNLPPSPITLSGLAGVPIGQYTGSIVVRNSTTGCSRDVTTATVCGVAAENGTVSLTSPSGLNFTGINFASYGNATGSCGNFVKGNCDAATSIPVVQSCVGQSSCSILASNDIFGDPCTGTIKNLLVELKAATFSIIISPLTASITTAKPTICTGEYTTLTATPGETYLWNTGATTRSITVDPTTTTAYSCTVTNLGCNTSSASQTITVNPSPSATVSTLTPSVCKNAGTYNLSISSVTNSPNQYSIVWGDNVTAMNDMPFTAFSGTTLPITGITSTVYGSFPATIYLKNTATGCVGNITGATVCNSVSEGSTLTMTAPGTSKFISIPFASFGTPTGGCGSFATGACHYANSVSTVRAAAYNNSTFSILAHGSVFSPDPCGSTVKTLAVQATYSSFAMTVVNATVTATPVNQSGCAGTNEPVYTVPTAGANSISWTNTNTSIGLAASGSDNTNPYQVPLFMATNSGLTPITGTVVVTPSSATCTGAMGTLTYTINPTPSVTNQTATICSGSAFNASPTGVPVGTTYSWSAPTGTGFSGGSAQSGQTSISQTLTATTTNPATATYSVTPSYSGCGGTPFSVVVQVDPASSYTYNSTGTFVVPAGVTSLTIEAWGGGGAGGGATGNPSAGGGGAGGAYVKSTSISVTPSTSYTVTVGAGGTGGTGTGPAGGSSWFRNTSTLLAIGGNGGNVASTNNTTAAGAVAATSGNVGGTVNFYGGNGGTGGASGASGGGGGSSAGTGSVGTNGSGITGGTVTGGGSGANGSTAGANGVNGSSPGGGGAGARTNATTDRNGGSGGAGRVIIVPTTTISYSSTSFCKSVASAAVTIVGNSAGTFSSTAGLTLDATTGTITPSTSTAGAYTIVYESACATLATFDMTIIDLPTANAGAAMAAICQGGTSAALGGSVAGTATGGTWSTTSGGTFTPNANNLNATWAPPAAFTGTATLVLTTTGGTCTAATANKTILVKPTPATPGITGTVSYTAGGTLNLVAASTAGSTYAWTPPGTAVGLSGASTNTISKTGIQNTEAGTYSVIATLNGCASATANTVVTVSPLITTSGTLSAVSTTYGAPSATTSFTVSGQSITQASGVTITAPTGYEVSTSSTFASNVGTTITTGGIGAFGPTTIYVRLAATTPVGSYSTNVVISSTGSSSVNVATVLSTVSARGLTITAVGASKAYGTTLTGGAGSSDFTSIGLQNSQTIGSVTVAYGTGAASGAGVGTYPNSMVVSAVTGGTFTPSNYTISYMPANIVVTAKTLTITSAAAANKPYDRTTAAVITGSLSGVIAPDGVTFSGTGTFATANVGTGITVTSTITLGGAQAGNYTLTQPTGLTANITVRPLTISGLTGVDKVYDGGTTATTLGTGALVGVIAPDAVSLDGTPVRNFADKNVGTSKAITITGYTLGGAGASNYTLTQPTGITANITGKPLTITGASVPAKPYDRTTAAVINGTLSGVVSPDMVTLNGTGTFASANVGTGVAVTSTSTLGGANAGNYTLTQPTGLTGTITGKILIVTSPAVTTKEYDGATAAAITGALAGVVSPDMVTLNGTGTFASANVGTGVAVTSTSTLGGANAGNYTLTQPTGLTGNITAKPLTITANNVNKTYGTTITGGTGSTAFIPNGLVSPQTIGSVTIAYGTGAAATVAVNTYIGSVTASSATGGTFSASNYNITYAVGDIVVNPKGLTITANNASKCFGSTLTFASTQFTSSGLVNTDAVSGVTLTSAGSGSGATVAGSPYPIVPSAATGTGLSNYTISYANGVLTVYALPTVYTVTGGTTNCGSVTVGINGSQVGYTYLLNIDGVYTGTSVAGTGAAISGASNVAGTYTVVARNDANTSCTATMTGNAIVHANPTAFSVTGGTANCGSATIGVNNSQTGYAYQLKRAGVNTGTPLAGTGAAISFGTLNTAGTYTVVATNNNNTSCATTMTGTAVIFARPSSAVVSGTASVCSGASTNLSVAITGGASPYSVTYIPGTGTVNVTGYTSGSSISVSPTSTTAYTLSSVTDANACTPVSLSGTATVTVNPLPIVTNVATASACTGSGPNIALTSSIASSFAWTLGTNTGGITGATASSGSTINQTLTNPSSITAGSIVYNVVPTATTTSCVGPQKAIAVTVNVATAVATHPVASTICNGANTTFTVAAVGTGLTYQWREYGANIPNGGAFSDVTTPTLIITGATSSQDNKYYSVYVQGTCGSAVISNDALLTVKQSPVITSHPGSTSACNAGTVNYVVIASGYGLNYQWRANGSTIANNATYSGTNTNMLTLNNVNAGMSGTNYSVVISNGCGTPATSTNATFNIVPTVTPTISISTVSPTTVCNGTSVTYTAAISNGGGTPSYQWKINGSNVGPDASSFTASSLVNGDVVSNVLTSNSQCVTSNTVTSNNIGMTVLTPSVTAGAAPSTTVCVGSNVSFTATPVNGGTPAYQWKRNGSNIGGATSSSYATTALLDNDQISVVMTPTGTCTSPVASNNLTMTILALPAITAQSGDLSKCFGDNATFAVTATGAGLSYQWKKGASIIGSGTASSYIINGVANSDAASYSVVVSGTCTPSVASNTVTLTVGNSNTWNGATSTDWHTGSNWTCGIMPNVGLDAIIPSSLTLYPVVATSATATAKNVSLASGSSLTLSANSTFNVYGNWNNAGIFYPKAGTVDFKGSSAQTITKSGTTTKENFYNLTLSSGNTLNVASTTDVDVLAGGTVLIASGTLDVNNRAFTLKSWAPYTLDAHKVDSTARLGRVGGTIANSANFAIERYIPTPIEASGRAFAKVRHICSPMQSVAASQWADSVTIFGGSGTYAFRMLPGWNPLLSSLQSYYEPSTFGNVNKGYRPILDRRTNMNVGQGYSLTVGFDGNVNYRDPIQDHVVLKSKGIPTVGDFSQPLTKSGADPYGWNLVGNPYPGEIDWDLVWAANQSAVSSTVSLYDPQGGTTSGSYYYYNARTGKSVDPRYSIDSVGYFPITRLNRSMIASSQGFFVFARNEGNSSLLFKESHKPLTELKVIGNYRVGDAISTVNIGVSNGTVHDNALIYLDNRANTYGYDADLDAFKSANTSLSVFTSSFGKDLAMNGISPENGVDVPVSVTASTKGTYRLTVRLEDGDLVGSRLYLKDGNTGTLTELNAGAQTFSFEVAANNATVKRFSIVSGNVNVVTGTPEVISSTTSGISIYPNPVVGDKLTIQMSKGSGAARQVEITDLNGVLVHRLEIQGASTNYVVEGLSDLLSSGVYSVRAISEEGVKQQKFVYLK